MNKSNIVIELTNSCIKVLIGYVLNGRPIVLYATTRPINDLIKNGNITDLRSLIDLIKDNIHIEDQHAQVRFDIKKAIVVLPPLGLEVFCDYNNATAVSSSDSRINYVDLRNVVGIICKHQIENGNVYVNIIPQAYVLENGYEIQDSPINKKSDYIGVKAMIYTLPLSLIKTYRGVIENANIEISKQVIAPHCIASLLLKEKDFVKTYIYVDIGAEITTVSLISNGLVYSSSFFLSGGNYLTRSIADNFNLNFKDAELIKRHYGFDSRPIPYDPDVIKSTTKEGTPVIYKVSDLNGICKNYADNFLYSLNTCLNEVLASQGENQNNVNFPLVFGGGGIRLIGFFEYLKNNLNNQEVLRVPLSFLGARHEKYLNCLGALLSGVDLISFAKNNNSNDNK